MRLRVEPAHVVCAAHPSALSRQTRALRQPTRARGFTDDDREDGVRAFRGHERRLERRDEEQQPHDRLALIDNGVERSGAQARRGGAAISAAETDRVMTSYIYEYGTAKSTFSSLRLHALFLEAPNNVRFVHNAALPYHPPSRPFRYHPGAARSPLKPVETASGC